MSKKSSVTFQDEYGLEWVNQPTPLEIEMHYVKKGGYVTRLDDTKVGKGLFHHFKKLKSILWPDIVWHRWNEEQTKAYLNYRLIGVIGPASSGKSHTAGTDVLADYYCFPKCTTVLVSSTTRESLENRIWGEIKKYHRIAKERFPDLPGNLIEGKQRIITDSRQTTAEGRDFRNGLCGVPCKKGQNYQGLAEYAGIKNTRVRLCADELHFMPADFVTAISNLNKNPDFKCLGLGNPKDITDALGKLCEPSAEMGGWDGGIDQSPGTKTWPLKVKQGICVQLVGSDSPNLDGSLGIPLITQKDIDEDIKFYGKDSLQFTMMDEGRMPRGQASKRVITRQLCLKFGAMEEPVWKDEKQTKVCFLDAACGGVGGDRNVFGELWFGKGVEDKHLLWLRETMVVPVSVAKDKEPPEDQIATFCKEQCEDRGVAPNQFFFDTTGRGALMNAFGRLWSNLIGGIEFGGKASERPVSEMVDVLCCDYYFNFVSELWFSSRLVIEGGQFRGMTEDVMNEGCMREWGKVAGNKIQVEPKEKMKIKTSRSPDLYDALCFQSGTTVLTTEGEKPIESITSSDKIVTPFGWSYAAILHENDSSNLCEVTFSNGKSLVGTSGHKIFTNQGWKRLDAMSVDMEVDTSDNTVVWHTLNVLFTKASNTGFKALVDTIHAAKNTVNKKDFFTESFGRSTLGLFLKACASITKMGIGRIMGSGIYGWLKHQSINLNTWLNDLSFSSGWPMKYPHLEGFRQPNGIVQKQAESGMGFMRSINGQKRRESKIRVSVERSFLRFSLVGEISAPLSAEENTLGSVLKTLVELAKYAVRNFWHTGMAQQHIAPVTVRQLPQHESRKVYNLTLEKDNAYYANGILVANCAGIEGARRLGFVIAKLANVANLRYNDEWKQELRDRRDKVRKQLNYKT